MGVYQKVPIEACWRMTGKVSIKTRWVDTSKTDSETDPNYRSRLVAREFHNSEKLELFAGTPPLGLSRALIAKIAEAQADRESWCKEYFKNKGRGYICMMYSDIARAYFNATIDFEQYVELPEEDHREPGDHLKCAKLRVAMYGTRGAAQAWEIIIATG